MPNSHDSARFTPGPWFVSEMHRDEVYCSRDGYFELVCEMGGNADNARLIAAAPEMYEALQRIRESETRYIDGEVWVKAGTENLEGLCAALAKANGSAQP